MKVPAGTTKATVGGMGGSLQAVSQVNAAFQVVKSDSATVTVPELEFEIPMGTQKGIITTVEGMLREASEALSVLQPQRAQQDPETAAVISQFLGAYHQISPQQQAHRVALQSFS